MPRYTAIPKKVNFLSNKDDFRCYLYSSMGLSTKAIAERTGLTIHQVNYRIQKAEKSRNGLTTRMQWRNFQGPVVKAIMTVAMIPAQSSTIRILKSRGLYRK